MSRPGRLGSPGARAVAAVAALAAVVLATVGVVTIAPTSAMETTTATTAAADTETLTVDDAVLSWSVNDESNNKAFAPGTFNFLAAGAAPDPGRGGQRMVAPGVWQGTSVRAWRARSGAVSVEKQQPDGTYAAATFAGLSTTVDGSTLSSTNGPFSGHRVRISGGEGTVDAAAGTARLEWQGSFSVVYYSGFSFFTVSDPFLVLADGRSRLRATLAGYAADRDDASQWDAVPPRTVTLADLPGDLVLPTEGGFTVQPSYLGVRFDAPADGAPQLREGATWGAFPASFLSYLSEVGSAAFWYSSGGSADAFKVPAPLTVSYDAAAPVEPIEPVTPPGPSVVPPAPTTTVNPPPPTSTPSAGETAEPTPSPTTAVPGSGGGTTPPAAPAAPALPDPLETDAAPSTDPVAAPPGGPAAAAVAPAAAVVPLTPQTVLALSSTAAPDPGPRAASPAWRWWLGSALLLGAAALTLIRHRARGTS